MNFDIAIIGSGPAGLTAAIYALRGGLSVGIFEKAIIGGQVSLTYEVKNYPGFENIVGSDLSLKMHNQATNLGAKTIYGDVSKIEFDHLNNIITSNGKTYVAKSVLLCMGAKSRTLGVEGESELTGKGVCYCAVCDGALYKDSDVVIVGGGNSAVEEAIYLSNLCKSVTMINNLPQFTCQESLKKEIENVISKRQNITVYHNTLVKKINGENFVESVDVENAEDETKTLKVKGIFIAIGRIPDTAIVRNCILMDQRGYIQTDDRLQTNIEGVFACGDVRLKDIRQIVTACADGAIAATYANTFINCKNCESKSKPCTCEK